MRLEVNLEKLVEAAYHAGFNAARAGLNGMCVDCTKMAADGLVEFKASAFELLDTDCEGYEGD